MLTSTYYYVTMKNNSLKKFLQKINANLMNIEQKAIDFNCKMYPNPTYVSHSDILEIYPKMNWRKIKKYAVEKKLVRTVTKKMLEGAKFLYNPNNPDHQGKPLIDTLYYAKEDFKIFLEKEEAMKKSPKLILDELNTKIGKKTLLRDFRRETPDLNEIDMLSDSYATFIAYLAKEKLKENMNNLNINEYNRLNNLLDSVIPNVIEE